MSTTALFNLEDIAPKKHPRYSKNLHAWVRKEMKKYKPGLDVFQGDGLTYIKGRIYIGRKDEDGWHILTSIPAILTQGAGADACAHPKNWGIVEFPDFWKSYLAIGRCAIDKEHKTPFLDDETRWEQTADTRRCLWCGNHTQHLRRWTETVEKSAWVAIEGGSK